MIWSGTSVEGSYQIVTGILPFAEMPTTDIAMSLDGTSLGRSFDAFESVAKRAASALIGETHVTDGSRHAASCAGSAKSPAARPGSMMTKCRVFGTSARLRAGPAWELETVAPSGVAATLTIGLRPAAR